MNTWDDIVTSCRHAADTGWDGIWVPDHFMPPESGYGDEPEPAVDPELTATLEGWTLLAGLAASVTRVRLGVLVTGNTYRHPALVAKMAATVDHISGGRAVLGLGAGWQENEHRHYGLAYPSPAGRARRLDEACRVLLGLLGRERTDFVGRHYRLDSAPAEPKPLGELPLMLGAQGEKLMMPVVARHADEWNLWADPERFAAKSAVLDRLCRDVGRDPAEIRRSAAVMIQIHDDPSAAAAAREVHSGPKMLIGTPEELRAVIARYPGLGCDELMVADFNVHPDDRIARMDRLMEEIIRPATR